jgi:hypothetical protein
VLALPAGFHDDPAGKADPLGGQPPDAAGRNEKARGLRPPAFPRKGMSFEFGVGCDVSPSDDQYSSAAPVNALFRFREILLNATAAPHPRSMGVGHGILAERAHASPPPTSL